VCYGFLQPEFSVSFFPRIGSVVCNLSLLCWFKYAVFAAGVLHDLGLSVPIPQVVLPIGISFFTFQGMSYVLDVYRGDAQPERNILRVALYIALFPQLVAGPIVRYTTVVGEIRVRRETVDDFADGATRFLFGLAKKMLLANPLGQIADAAFATSATIEEYIAEYQPDVVICLRDDTSYLTSLD
jgi:D-alanyl-lipoteichoic acid acyltransferase DltB (MBOAT superfamily)